MKYKNIGIKNMNTNLQYPIGKFEAKIDYTTSEIEEFKSILRAFPDDLKAICKNITAQQLDTTYRPGGWTAQQVIHHVADSHGNMLIRLKWSLTEDKPTIKAYYEDRWAEQSDYNLPIDVSISQIVAIHAKVMALVDNLKPEHFELGYIHPENGNFFSIKTVLALYSWHGAHHLAHLKICKGEL